MTDLTTNEDYLFKVIEINNLLVHETTEYYLSMPQTVGLNFRYSEIFIDIKTTPEFSGNITVSFENVFVDSDNIEQQLPAYLTSLADKSITAWQLSESNNEQTWKLLDTAIGKLKITLSQHSSGAGKFFFVIRGGI